MFQRVILFCCFAGLAAPSDQPDPSVIRVNTRLVEVDAIVRNKGGPVADLTKDEFTVLDNGKPQKIAIFSVKSIRRGSELAKPLPPGMVSNRLNPSGQEPEAATVVLWDSLNTEMGDQSFVRNEVLKYLGTKKRGDPVALYSMAKTLRVLQDFTEDPDRLIKAVTRTGPEQSINLQAADLGDLATGINSPMMAQNPNDPNSHDLSANQGAAQNAAAELGDYELRDRASLTEACMEAIAAHLQGLPGRKKLVWITGSFPAITRDQRQRVGFTQIEIQDFGPQIEKAVRKLNNANVAVYPIDPRGLATGVSMAKSTFSDEASGIAASAPAAGGLTLTGIDTMNLLASGTGGKASYGGNDIGTALKNAMEDDEVTYTLGFYASDEKLDGAYHNLSVKVSRKGVDVRSRQGYFGVDSKVAINGRWRESLNESMQNPLEATSVGLRAVAAPVPNQPGVYELEVSLDLSDLHLEREKDRWIALVGYATHFSPSESTKGTLETIRVSLTEERLRAALKDGYTFRRVLAAGDMKGELRVVVEDRNTGALGSVSVPIGKQ